MNKIRRISLCFRVFFQICMIALALLIAIVWIIGEQALNGTYVTYRFIPAGINIMHTLTLQDKLLGFLVSWIPNGITMLILYFLVRLFFLFERGTIFTYKVVSYIRKIAVTILVGQLLNPIYQGLISFILTYQNPHGHRMAMISFGTNNVSMVLMALIILLVSWIMAEGCKLREEQLLTV